MPGRHRLKLLMLGPGLQVKGGVSAVERLLLAAMPEHVAARHVATMEDANRLVKGLVFLRSLLRTRAALRDGVDIVHIHFASRASSVRKEWLARIALRAGARVLMHAHGAEYHLYWQEMSARQRRNTLGVLTRVDALVVLGERWRRFFTGIGVPERRIRVLPNPVALPPQVPVRPARERVHFVYLGIVDERKGAFDLVAAIDALPADVQARVHVTIAGNGELDRLRALVGKRGLDAAVTVLGWIGPDERDRLLADADAFVLPSHNEGLPMAMLEAMAWGLMPICTPVGSIPEVLSPEVNGLLVAPGDVAALAAAISHAATDRDARLRMAAAARATVEPLSIDRYMQSLCGLYAELLDNGARGRTAGVGADAGRAFD